MVNSRQLSFLFIAEDKFPPFRVDVSVLFGQEMVSRGHTIDWLLQSLDLCEESYETVWSGGRAWVGSTNNGTTRRARLDKHLRGIIHDVKMFALIRKYRYDFVQVKDKIISALTAIIAAKIYGGKFIYWLSFPFPEADLYALKERRARYPVFYLIRGTLFQWLLYRVILRFAHHIFVQSDEMRNAAAAMGIPKCKMTPVPMGIAPESLACRDSGQSFLTESGTRSIVYLGALTKERKLEFLVRVFAKVLKDIPNARLYFVGGGEDDEDIDLLKRETVCLGVEDAIEITGFLPREAALKYVRHADVCVSPIRPSPIFDVASPTKLVEYMAYGKPVVANDLPEQRTVIEESGGGICVPYEETLFAEAIVDLLKNPEKGEAMGMRGRQYVQQCRSYSTIADILEQKFFSLLGN